MRKLPRDLVTILRTEARNQRTPPIDYVIAEDGGRMVHRPEPDIAMAELLEEAANALEAAAEREEKLRADYDMLNDRFVARIEEYEACISKLEAEVVRLQRSPIQKATDDLRDETARMRALLHPTSETTPVSATSEGGDTP